jgi:hypothetical protein
MAKRHELIMASVFEDTKTLQIYLLWNRQGMASSWLWIIRS